MAARKKIAILLHEQDRYPKVRGHFIWSLCDLWREWGCEIETFKGTGKRISADLLISHVDATVLPEGYADFLQKYPKVVNGRINDISKRIISRNLLTRADMGVYDGQVIVKTNLNNGGLPDVKYNGTRIDFQPDGKKSFWSSLFQGKKSSADLAQVNCMNTDDYRVYPSLKEVPEGVFANESLVVERFLPEYENGVYYLRVYKFLGDRAYCARLGSSQPIVKSRNIVSREEVSIPDEIVAYRRGLGMDYGKIDFAVRDGRVVVFDVNRTPGLINPVAQLKANAARLAEGIKGFF